MSSGWFDLIEHSLGTPNFLNLHGPHYCRNDKVCRVHSHEFGVIRLYRTFSRYTFKGEAKCAACFCTRSG